MSIWTGCELASCGPNRGKPGANRSREGCPSLPCWEKRRPVDVVDIELHPMEPPIQGRAPIASHGCVILHYMPKHLYVRVKNCDSFFLISKASASQPGVADLKGVIAVSAQSRSWRSKNEAMKEPVSFSRTQMPLLPRKQCTLHGVQGKTADPGFIAHWSFWAVAN